MLVIYKKQLENLQFYFYSFTGYLCAPDNKIAMDQLGSVSPEEAEDSAEEEWAGEGDLGLQPITGAIKSPGFPQVNPFQDHKLPASLSSR